MFSVFCLSCAGAPAAGTVAGGQGRGDSRPRRAPGGPDAPAAGPGAGRRRPAGAGCASVQYDVNGGEGTWTRPAWSRAGTAARCAVAVVASVDAKPTFGRRSSRSSRAPRRGSSLPSRRLTGGGYPAHADRRGLQHPGRSAGRRRGLHVEQFQVATVSSDGRLTALAPGRATIRPRRDPRPSSSRSRSRPTRSRGWRSIPPPRPRGPATSSASPPRVGRGRQGGQGVAVRWA